MSDIADRLAYLFTPEGGWGKCSKCYCSSVEIAHVLDADDNYEGESLHCRSCGWLSIEDANYSAGLLKK